MMLEYFSAQFLNFWGDEKLITQTGLKIGVDVRENEYDFLACVKVILLMCMLNEVQENPITNNQKNELEWWGGGGGGGGQK
jgi:hypothetical protein